jgi:hypothetical protein
MPISREEFEFGRMDLSVPILQYLGIRRNEAFTPSEILYALTTVYERRATLTEVSGFLMLLVRNGQLETKEVSGAQMYTIIVDSE